MDVAFLNSQTGSSVERVTEKTSNVIAEASQLAPHSSEQAHQDLGRCDSLSPRSPEAAGFKKTSVGDKISEKIIAVAKDP